MRLQNANLNASVKKNSIPQQFLPKHFALNFDFGPLRALFELVNSTREVNTT